MQLIWCLLSKFISTCFGHHYANNQENKTVHCSIWCSALVVMAMVVWSWNASCSLVLLMMGIMMPETCWD